MALRSSTLAIARFLIFLIVAVISDVRTEDFFRPIDPFIELLCPPNQLELNDLQIKNSSIIDDCQAFFDTYVHLADNFTDCELKHTRPFRLCSNCVAEYKLISDTYTHFSNDVNMKTCREKYIDADRVQVLPSLQNYIDQLWSGASCSTCAADVTLDSCTGIVNYTIPKDIQLFLSYFHNLSVCLNTSLEEGNIQLWRTGLVDIGGNASTMCVKCLDDYNLINDHYNSMSSLYDGDICMDIVDRMNYTRLIWSHRFGCSCRSANPASVLTITVILGLQPLFFYGILRYVGKTKKAKVFKQKRLSSMRGLRTLEFNAPSDTYPSTSSSNQGILTS